LAKVKKHDDQQELNLLQVGNYENLEYAGKRATPVIQCAKDVYG